MAEWICSQCNWSNSEKWVKCAKCGYPEKGTDEDRQAWNYDNEHLLEKQKAMQAYASRPDVISANIQGRELEVLQSINGKMGFIVAIIVIGIILQLLGAFLTFIGIG